MDSYTLLQDENALTDARDSLTKLAFSQNQTYEDTVQDLTDAYEDAYNEISDSFLDLPDTITELNKVLYGLEISESQVSLPENQNIVTLFNTIDFTDYDERDKFENYTDSAEDYFDIAKNSYNTSFDNYLTINRYADKETIENLLSETIETFKQLSDALKSEINMLDFWVEYRTDNDLAVYDQVNEYQTSLGTYTSQTNSDLNNLLSIQRTITDSKITIKELEQNQPLDLAAAKRSVVEKEEKLSDLLAGATELEIKNKELIVQQKYNSLAEANQDWLDYQIRAPFDGIVAALDVAVGDSVGSSDIIASIITNQKIAEVTLNEIDAAQVAVGQKVTLEFDAIPDLSVTGEIVEVDTLGTVDQGVVSYDIKIGFDIQDDRVKPGMSTSANIVTQSKQDVLLVPITAVKTANNGSYVEILTNGQPQKQTVITGANDDTMIEIIEGLAEGDEIIKQTITNGGNDTADATQNNQAFGQSMRVLR